MSTIGSMGGTVCPHYLFILAKGSPVKSNVVLEVVHEQRRESVDVIGVSTTST